MAIGSHTWLPQNIIFLMNIIDSFRQFFSPADSKVLHTKFGDFNLAKENDRKRLQKQVIEIMRTTDALTRKDIADWRNAWQMAINVDYPNRTRLYSIYRDVDIDLHLSGCVTQRKGMVLGKSFKLMDKAGTEQIDAMHYFDQQWFKQLLRYALDSIYWGHSLIELGDLTTDGDGCICYDSVKLIPRMHVIPEYGRVIVNVNDDWRSGIEYRKPPFSDWLIEAGAPDDLGLYLKAATSTIPKKNALAFWDTFAELFGMPMRIAHTSVRDDKELAKMERMMSSMGTEFWGIFQEGTDIEVKENARGDAFNVYDRRVDRANSELSKLIIGQTMTIEDGSSLSQSQTHLKVMEHLLEADCDMLRDVINNQLLPRMVKHGFPIDGLRFEWDYSTDYTPEQQKAYEELVLNNYEVDPKYFEEKYGMPVGERRPQSAPVSSGSPAGSKDSQQHNAHPFFD